jgi:epoxyqueuosine reductase
LGNAGDPRAEHVLVQALQEGEPLVRGHAAWALGRLGLHAVLEGRVMVEPDPWVREELKRALEAPLDAG